MRSVTSTKDSGLTGRLSRIAASPAAKACSCRMMVRFRRATFSPSPLPAAGAELRERVADRLHAVVVLRGPARAAGREIDRRDGLQVRLDARGEIGLSDGRGLGVAVGSDGRCPLQVLRLPGLRNPRLEARLDVGRAD